MTFREWSRCKQSGNWQVDWMDGRLTQLTAVKGEGEAAVMVNVANFWVAATWRKCGRRRRHSRAACRWKVENVSGGLIRGLRHNVCIHSPKITTSLWFVSAGTDGRMAHWLLCRTTFCCIFFFFFLSFSWRLLSYWNCALKTHIDWSSQ